MDALSPHSQVRTSTRAEWVDAARFIAMLAIIIQHSAMSTAVKGVNESIFIASWVQFFFFAGGYFYGKKAPTHYLDVRRALFFFYPYLIWTSLYLMINELPSLIAVWQTQGALQGMGYLLREGFGLGGVPIYRPMWFLRDFALFSLLAPLFLRCPVRVRWLITAFLICFPTHLLIPVSLEFTLPSAQGLRVFCLGMVLSPIGLDTARRTLYASPAGVLLVSLLLSALWYIHPGHYGEVCTELSIGGIGAAGILVCRYLPRLGRFLASFSPVIFLIYASHVLVITLVFKVAIPLGHTTLPDWFWALVIIPLLFAIPCGIYALLRRYAPGLLPCIAAARGK